MDANGKIQASVIVTNTGAQDGEEIVQLYLRDIVRSITPPVQELKGFKRVALKAGESKKVTFDIDVDMLKFYDSTLDYVAEPGEFQVIVRCLRFKCKPTTHYMLTNHFYPLSKPVIPMVL